MSERPIQLKMVPAGKQFILLRTGETFNRIQKQRRGPLITPGEIACKNLESGKIFRLSSRCEVRYIPSDD